MMLQANAISLAARELRNYLSSNIEDLDETRIFISHPSEGAETAEDNEGKHCLNLFFYRVEHGAYHTCGSSDDPYYVRLHCLITAFGRKNTEQRVSAGENDLRLIGSVMHLMNIQPAIRVNDNDNGEIAQLEVVVSTLSTEEINNIWSTQTETAYRLSVGYELALAPLPLARKVERSPLVARAAVGVKQIAAPVSLSSSEFSKFHDTIGVSGFRVDGNVVDWTPHISFVMPNGDLQYIREFSVVDTPTQLEIVTAGKIGEHVTTTWEVWLKEIGWKKLDEPDAENFVIQTNAVEQGYLENDMRQKIGLPDITVGQVVLYVSRTWLRQDGEKIKLRSNPLLITIYQE